MTRSSRPDQKFRIGTELSPFGDENRAVNRTQVDNGISALVLIWDAPTREPLEQLPETEVIQLTEIDLREIKSRNFWRLDSDKALLLCYDVLVATNVFNISLKLLPKHVELALGAMSAEERDEFANLDATLETGDVFLTEVYVRRFRKCGSKEWFAASAILEYFVYYDDFEFASLATELSIKLKHEDNALTGKLISEAGKRGAQMRDRKVAPKTLATLKEMTRLIENGQSISRAADLAAKDGYGASHMANRKLWDRHKKNSWDMKPPMSSCRASYSLTF